MKPHLKSHMAFKFVNESDLQNAIDKVRRARLKLKEQEIWSEFCAKEFQKTHIQNGNGPRSQMSPSFNEKTNHVKDILLDTDSDPDVLNNRILQLNLETKHNNFIQSEHYKHKPKKPKEKRIQLSYSDVTSISLPCSDSESASELRLKEIQEKINFTCSKILNVLEVIESSLAEIREPETPGEILQLHKKASEFCIRFSRNHFYQIELQFKNLAAIADNKYYLQTTKLKTMMYSQKILKMLQTLLLGFYVCSFSHNTFYRHMYIVWGYNGIAEKLNNLLYVTSEIFNHINTLQDVKKITAFNEIINISKRVIGVLKDSKRSECPFSHSSIPKKASVESRRIKSANCSVGKSSAAKEKFAPNSNRPSFNKRRVKSASSADPYYMYQNKPLDKGDYKCKFCTSDVKKCDRVSSDVFKRLTMNQSKVRLNLAHNVFSHRISNEEFRKHNQLKIYSNNLKGFKGISEKQIKQPCDNKSGRKVQNELENNLQKNTEQKNSVPNVTNKLSDQVLVERLIPLISDHFRGIYENVANKSKHKNSISQQYNISIGNVNSEEYDDVKRKENGKSKNVQTIIVSYKPKETNGGCRSSSVLEKQISDPLEKVSRKFDETKCHSDSEINNMKKLPTEFSKHQSNTNNEAKNSSMKVDCNDKKQNQINKISDKLITNELSSITMEIDKPLQQFIRKELVDFSDFLYKTHSIKN